MAEALHDYLSTACFHGLHARCRQRCKFCDVPCKCECHNWASERGAKMIDLVAHGAPPHLSIEPESGQPHVLISDNDYGIPPGARDVVRLLRENAERPEVVRFIADMLEI